MSFLDRIRNLGAPETAEAADTMQVRQLAGMGADLARPRHVVHVLFFADEASAGAGAAAIARSGYETTVEPPEAEDARWTLRAEAERVVDLSTVAAFRTWFEAVASDHGGEYDGWEAARKP